MKIEKASVIGFCPGVKRATDILEKVAHERGGIETLGAVVHNPQVLHRLDDIGVRVVRDVNDIQGDTVVISCHGTSPQIKELVRAKNINIIDTTCSFVRRAQVAAQKLVKAGFFVIVYGDIDHPEVKGILGQTGSQGMAALNEKFITTLDPLPRRLGILSQTTQIPANFTEFVKKVIDSAFTKDSELRIIDTICHDIRKRQEKALELARRADLMLIIGGHNSANTKRLAELCSAVTETYVVETADEIQPSWLRDRDYIGIVSGASTTEQTIDEVVTKLESMAQIRR